MEIWKWCPVPQGEIVCSEMQIEQQNFSFPAQEMQPNVCNLYLGKQILSGKTTLYLRKQIPAGKTYLIRGKTTYGNEPYLSLWEFAVFHVITLVIYLFLKICLKSWELKFWLWEVEVLVRRRPNLFSVKLICSSRKIPSTFFLILKIITKLFGPYFPFLISCESENSFCCCLECDKCPSKYANILFVKLPLLKWIENLYIIL